MSHRIHGSVNNINYDEGGGGGYGPTRLQRRKPDGKTTVGQALRGSERSASRTRSTGTQQIQTLQPQQTLRTRTTNVRRPADPLKSEPTTSSVIHKELYTDNPALVEVTVKTHNVNQRSRSTSVSRREPWSKVLKNEGSYENVSSFTNFDPLRTLHFIAKELHSKLLDSFPNDKNVQQMVVDMQVALSRIPPEVASSVALQIDNQSHKKPSTETIKHTPFIRDPEEYPTVHVVKAPTIDKSCQTVRTNYVEAEKLQKHLEESSAKIETACKQMENVCTRLKSEKEELEIMLRAERETVKFLRKQMEQCDNEQSDALNLKIQTLQQERDMYQSQVKKLKAQVESQQETSAQELKTIVLELRKQKATADEQITVLNHNLTLANMEKEKYVAILAARDRQIKEIRAEMSQLQEVVNEQLADLQNAPSSITSSITNITADWMAKVKESKVETNSLSSGHVDEPLYKDKKLYKECPSGDSMILKDRDKKDKKIDQPSELQNNIRDMFAEIKKQALLVTANNHADEDEGYRNEQPR